MKIESVEFYYAALPEITVDVDGSQDALLVRVTADGLVGWGECEASPVTSIAAFVTPPSHGACQPVSASVRGERIDSPHDILRISAAVRRNSMDLLQAAHVWSGIEMALWDLLGKARQEPVWALLGYEQSIPKTAYASLLFGDTPQATYERARESAARGFQATKFGWGPFGAGTLDADRDQLQAARDGIGDGILMVDAGQIWEGDVEAALARLPILKDVDVAWLEEPFAAESFSEYALLARDSTGVPLAGGEGSHNARMAENLITYGGVAFIQIDSGRIGGIGPSKQVADFAAGHGVQYVNHSFTSHLALSASLQPFAGAADMPLAEYPAALSTLGAAIASPPVALSDSCRVHAPDAVGLGVDVHLDALTPYLRSVELRVDGAVLYASPRSEEAE